MIRVRVYELFYRNNQALEQPVLGVELIRAVVWKQTSEPIILLLKWLAGTVILPLGSQRLFPAEALSEGVWGRCVAALRSDGADPGRGGRRSSGGAV